MGDYQELANILNLAMVCKDDDDRYFVVASWLDSHDQLIKELLSSPDVFITPRKRYSTTGRNGSVHFTADDGGRVFVCITKENYPARVGCSQHWPNHHESRTGMRAAAPPPLEALLAFLSFTVSLWTPRLFFSLSPPGQVAHMCLEEMQDHILLSPHNSASLVATRPHQLSEAMLPILDDLIDKFDDPAQADALTSVHRKIDVTTNTMQENIALLLENDAKVTRGRGGGAGLDGKGGERLGGG